MTTPRILVTVLALLAAGSTLTSQASAATSASQLPLPPLQPLPAPLPPQTLDTSALNLEYVTIFRPSSGTDIVRRNGGLLNVPKAIDVDGNGTNDLIATLSVDPTSMSRLQLRFQRPAGATAKLPVSAEAIVADPTPGDVLPREKVNFGFDGRADTAPDEWLSTVTVGSQNGEHAVDVSTTSGNPGISIKTLGGMFDGDALSRTAELGGSVEYLPVPPTATLGVTLGSTTGELRAGADYPVTARADVEVSTSSTRKRVLATVVDLPQTVRVRQDSDAGSVRYSASADIPSLDVELHEIATTTRKTLLDLTRIPTEIGVTSTATGRTTAQVGSGAIGSATIAVASGDPALLSDPNPYVNVVKTAHADSVAVRVDELQSAVLDTVDGLGAEVQLAPGTSAPFHVRAELAGRTVDGTTSGLPRHLRVAYTPSVGQIYYSGFGTPINAVDVSIFSPTPLFGRVNLAKAHVEGLPPSLTLTLGKSAVGATGAAFTATPQAKLVEARFASVQKRSFTSPSLAPEPTLPAGEYGVVLRDMPSNFWAFVRLRNVTGGELSQTDGRLRATLRTAPEGTDYQDVKLLATLNKPDDAVTVPASIDGFIRDLPTVLTFDQQASQTTITGNRPIPYAKLTATNMPVGVAGQSLRGQIHNLDVTLTSLPQTFTVVHGKTQQGLWAPAGHFGQIDFAAWDDTGRLALPTSPKNMFRLDQYDGRQRVSGRVSGMRRGLVTSYLTTKLETAFGLAQQQIDFSMIGGSLGNGTSLDASLLPAAGQTYIPTQGTLELVAPQKGIHLIWTANARARAYVSMASSALRINYLDFALPATAEICVGGRYNCHPATAESYAGHSVPNNLTVFTKASAHIVVSGHICVPNAGDTVVYQCPGGREILLDALELQTARLELAKTDEHFKIHLNTDAVGVNAKGIRLKFDPEIIVRATGVRNAELGKPFTGVSEIGGVADGADSEYQLNKMTCGGLQATIVGTEVGDLDGKWRLFPSQWCA